MTDSGFTHDSRLREQVTSNLAGFEREQTNEQALAGAAVALVISPMGETDIPCLLVTLRSAKLKKHPNQFALPGGKIDEGESVEQTALRELHEELGLSLPDTAVLGRIDDFATRSGFRISPVVVWHDGNQVIKANEDEVAKVFQIPFNELFLPQIPEIITEDDSDPILTSLRTATLCLEVAVATSLFMLSLVVADYNDAIAYFCGKLDFSLIEDTTIVEQNKRWVVVAPPSYNGVRLSLAKAEGPEQQAAIGNPCGRRVFLFPDSDNFYRDYRHPLDRGADFLESPREELWHSRRVLRSVWQSLGPDSA